jgi:hypothetical protein
MASRSHSYPSHPSGSAPLHYAPQASPVLIPPPANMQTSQQNSAFVNTYKPPWVDPPPQFDPVDVIDYVALPAIGDSEIIVSYQVSKGRNGIIHSYANNFVGGSFQEGGGQIYWQYLRNGNPIKFYNMILASLGSVAQPTRHPSGFRIFENDLIQIKIFNVSLAIGGGLSGGRLLGWQYPKKYEDPRTWV